MPFQVALIAAGIKMALAIGFIMLAVPMLVWLERKLIADFQARIGPSRVGPFGLLQSFVDGIKLLTKENITPTHVDRLLYFAAPMIAMIPALAVAAVIPFGGDLRVGEYVHHLLIADIPVGILFVLALTSLGVYGIVLCGWASNNKYSLLGGLRSSAQMVSYELPMGLSVVTGFMIASAAAETDLFSLSLRQIVDLQGGWFWNWVAFNPKFLFLGLLAALTFYICGLAETNRAPFDLPEAETELVGGYHTEYGGMKWAMFFLGEYAAMLNVAAITTTVFLGGWHAPYPDTLIAPYGSIAYALHGLFWFGLKVFVIIFVYMWLRATLPRLRYDRLMGFTWKGLVPFTLANLVIVATILTGWSVAEGTKPPAFLVQGAVAETGPEMRPGLPPQFQPGAQPSGSGPLPGMPGAVPGGRPAPGLAAPEAAPPAGAPPAGGVAPPAGAPGATPPPPPPPAGEPAAEAPAAAPVTPSPGAPGAPGGR